MLKHWQPTERAAWDALVTKSQDGGLLQSWAWGEFQERLGNAVYNVSDEGQTWLAQCVQLKAGSQWILQIPRGPVWAGAGEPDATSLKRFLAAIKTLANERSCFLVRLDPAFATTQSDLLTAAGCQKASRDRNPAQTLAVDLTQSEDAILAAMKNKWRYNIKVAQKKSVTVRFSENPQDAAIFMTLVEKTTDRQGFASYDSQYFSTLMSQLGPKRQASFAIAEFQSQPIAALLLASSGATTYYLHGASNYEQRNLMAPHLLQWEAMRRAKQQGAKTYDFWGVSEKQWPGVTRFKQGFAPTTACTSYVGTYELPVKKLTFWLYRLRQRIR